MSFCKNQEGLKSGVYILKTSNKTYKILVGGVK